MVARTQTGELWPIQAKAYRPDLTIKKSEIDSFLSESNRGQFSYRLLMATTDKVGRTALRTIKDQEKPVGPRGLSLAKFLHEHGRKKRIPDLTVKQIVGWIRDYLDANWEYSTRNSGKISGTKDTWSKIDTALKQRGRGLKHELKTKSSLAKVIEEHFPDPD